MAKKPCKIKVKLQNGRIVVPELGKQLVEKLGSEKGHDLMRSILSEDFYRYFGNFIKNPSSELFSGKLDKQNMPKLEYVLKYKEEIYDQKAPTSLREKWLGKEKIKTLDLKLKYVHESIDTLKQQIQSFNRTKGAKDYIDNLKELTTLLEDYTGEENEKAFLTFLDNAAEHTAKILNALDKIGAISQLEWNNKKTRDEKKRLVQDMYTYIKGYGDLATQILNDYDAKAEEAEGLDVINDEEYEILEELRTAGRKIERKYKIAASNIIAHEYAPHLTSVRNKLYVDKYRKEFQEENPIELWATRYKLEDEKVSKEKWQAKRDEYVWEQLAKDKEEIYQDQVRFMKDILFQSNMDVSGWDASMVALGRQKDTIAQLLSEKFDTTDDKIRQSLLIKVTEFYGLTKTFEKERRKEIGRINIAGSELYDPFIEKEMGSDVNRTKHMIEEYHSDFYIEKKKMLEKSFSDKITKKEGKAIRREWFRENITRDPHYAKLARRGKIEAAKKYQADMAAKGVRVVHPKKKWKNPQWDKLMKSSEATLNLYKALMELQRGSDLMLPGAYKLGSKIYQYRREGKERVITDSKDIKSAGRAVWEAIKEGARQSWLVQEDDEIRGEERKPTGEEEFFEEIYDIEEILAEKEGREVYTDVEGKTRRYIPIHGRADVGVENMSFNLVDLALKNYATALHFYEYNKILPEVQMIEHFVKNRQVAKMEGFDRIYNKAKTYFKDIFLQSQKEGTAGTSNVSMLVKKYIDQRVYQINAQGWMGKSTRIGKDKVIYDIGDGTLAVKKAKEISNAKVIGNIGTYAGALLLQFNYLATGANFNYGQTMARIEAIGGYYWNRRNLTHSYYKFVTDMPNILNDIGKVKPQSFVGLMLEKYDAMNNFNIRTYDFASTSKFTQLAKADTLWASISLPEYLNHGVPLLAYLDNIKVFNKEGKYLTRTGTTTDVKKGLSLLDVHEKELNEKDVASIKIDDRVAYTSLDGKTDPTKTDFISRHLVRPLQLINGYIQGHYARNNKFTAEFDWLGTLVASMRRFMIPGFGKRWRNISKIWSEKARQPNLQNYQMGLETEMTGDYVSSILFLKTLLRDVSRFKFKLGSISNKEWNNLESYERAQIRRTIGELGYIAVTGVVGTMLAAAADEDDTAEMYLLALWANRLNSELRQYMSYTEFSRILGSPAVSMTLLERIFRLLDQLIDDNAGFGPYDQYSTGKRKGETKIKYRIRDLVPWWKQAQKHTELQEAMEYYVRNKAKFGR